ncbi:DUF2384 domain-containing protein [Halomonas alkaliantarctica]|nr:DUF2384 domain-containing protein [Halomonas alkaliantarctica]
MPVSPPSADDPLTSIFAYRAFDLRDRFPQPLSTFREALECLQSDDAYLPALSGDIVAYLRGGGALSIPESFFIRCSGNDVTFVSAEDNDAVCEAVDRWLRDTVTRNTLTSVIQEASPMRPGRLDLLLEQCDPNAPESDEVNAWRDMPDVGREGRDPPRAEDVGATVVDRFGKTHAKRWMTTPHAQLESQRPIAILETNPQRVYALLLQENTGGNE